MVQDDVSGDYKEILLAMIGERPPPAPVPEEEDAGEPELEEVEEEHIEVRVNLVIFLRSYEIRSLNNIVVCASYCNYQLWFRIKTKMPPFSHRIQQQIYCLLYLHSH